MLSTEDRLAIQSLYARYSVTFDLCDTDGWVDCWSRDGYFKSARLEMRGHAELRTYFEKRISGLSQAPLENVQHWNNSLVVEGDGQRATGLCYLLLIGRRRGTGELSIQMQGTYTDELAKDDGRWRFSTRRVALDLPTIAAIPTAD